MASWLLWLTAAVVFAIIEIFTPGFYFICLGLSALFGMLGAIAGLSFSVQLAFFLAAMIIVMIFLRPFMLKLTKSNRTNAERMIGRIAIVVSDIPLQGKGEVRIDGVNWPAVSASMVKKGSKVEIEGIEGITLTVKEV